MFCLLTYGWLMAGTVHITQITYSRYRMSPFELNHRAIHPVQNSLTPRRGSIRAMMKPRWGCATH